MLPLHDRATRIIELEGVSFFRVHRHTHPHDGHLATAQRSHAFPGQSAEEVLEAIAAHAKQYPEQNPVLGSVFGRAFGIDGPTAAQLDAVVPTDPRSSLMKEATQLGPIHSPYKPRTSPRIRQIRYRAPTSFSATCSVTQPGGWLKALPLTLSPMLWAWSARAP